MSTPTDLQGLLWNDEMNLERRLRDLVGAGRYRQPWKLYAHFKHDGSTGWTKVVQDITGDRLDMAGVRNLVERVEAAISESLGPDPMGILRIRAYEDGKSAEMPLDFTRSLRPDLAVSSDQADPWKIIAMFRAENAELRAHNRELHGQLIASKTSSDTLAAESVKQVAQLGSVRAAASAAGDVSGVSGIVTLIVIAVGVPVLRRALDLPEGASLSQIVTLLQLRMERSLKDLETGGRSAPSPPERARADAPQLEDHRDDVVADDASSEVLPDPDELLARVKQDSAYLERLKASVKADAELMTLLIA
ncbi:MAG: hypothetical protein H6739_07845 [Alphaproteobacteria bacterium]|nr:hypothetical protein [Alphaproteobacteria bacterium]